MLNGTAVLHGVPRESERVHPPAILTTEPRWGTRLRAQMLGDGRSGNRQTRRRAATSRVGRSAAGGGGGPRPCRPAAAPSSEPLAGNRLRAKSRGDGQKPTRSPRRRAMTPQSRWVRGGRLWRVKALSPRCSAEHGTPGGKHAAGEEQGRQPEAPPFTSPPSDDPAESGGPLREAGACQGLDAPLQRQ